MRTRNDHKVQRIKDEAARNERWAGLTAGQKLDELDRRLGRNMGATRERTRYLKEALSTK